MSVSRSRQNRMWVVGIAVAGLLVAAGVASASATEDDTGGLTATPLAPDGSGGDSGEVGLRKARPERRSPAGTVGCRRHARHGEGGCRPRRLIHGGDRRLRSDEPRGHRRQDLGGQQGDHRLHGLRQSGHRRRSGRSRRAHPERQDAHDLRDRLRRLRDDDPGEPREGSHQARQRRGRAGQRAAPGRRRRCGHHARSDADPDGRRGHHARSDPDGSRDPHGDRGAHPDINSERVGHPRADGDAECDRAEDEDRRFGLVSGAAADDSRSGCRLLDVHRSRQGVDEPRRPGQGGSGRDRRRHRHRHLARAPDARRQRHPQALVRLRPPDGSASSATAPWARHSRCNDKLDRRVRVPRHLPGQRRTAGRSGLLHRDLLLRP